jgi:hypothetical protein
MARTLILVILAGAVGCAGRPPPAARIVASTAAPPADAAAGSPTAATRAPTPAAWLDAAAWRALRAMQVDAWLDARLEIVTRYPASPEAESGADFFLQMLRGRLDDDQAVAWIEAFQAEPRLIAHPRVRASLEAWRGWIRGRDERRIFDEHYEARTSCIASYRHARDDRGRLAAAGCLEDTGDWDSARAAYRLLLDAADPAVRLRARWHQPRPRWPVRHQTTGTP